MNKIRIKSTPLFKQVAAVVGEERAQIELARVAHEHRVKCNLEFNETLVASFAWHYSPQGLNFWRSINRGVNPCSN